MYHINFEQPIHIHFIGIGGVSMSGLAEILAHEGFTVSGSDRTDLLRFYWKKALKYLVLTESHPL